MIRCQVLGALELEGVDGQTLAMTSGSQRRLVSILAVHANSVVRATLLEDWLKLSPGALRTSVSRLRRLVGADVLLTQPGGYELRVEVDAHDFERLVVGALSNLTDSDGWNGADRSQIEKALDLWRGDPYGEFDHEPWAEAEVQHINELHVAAAAELVSLFLKSGELALAIAKVDSLIVEHPYRDRLRALRIRALVDAGRRTDALREFQTYRNLLVEEIGIEPSASLVALDRAIASNELVSWELLGLEDHPAWRGARRQPNAALASDSIPAPNAGELPGAPSTFVGRSVEIGEVSDLVRNQRLVTLTGAGGCGKTRLAQEVAQEAQQHYQNRIWWVDLSLAPDSASVAEVATRAIGVGPAADVTGQLIRRLHGPHETLLILDNAEHVIEGTVDLLTALLPACPNIRVLVTSRRPLGPPGEVIWRVPSLSLPNETLPLTFDNLDRFDGVQLFLERARQARRSLSLDLAALSHVKTICLGLDGLPLALELAAAQTRTSSLADLAVEVEQATLWRLGRSAPTVGARTTSARNPFSRHVTLEASIAWSFNLMGPIEQHVLVSAAAFGSSFTKEAAIAVAVADGESTNAVGEAISNLVDGSLLQLGDRGERYRMLQTVRQFCIARSKSSAESEQARARHSRYYSEWASRVGEGKLGIDRGPFLLEMPNVLSALAWARENNPQDALQICVGLGAVWSTLGHNSDVGATCQWLLSLEHDGPLSAMWAAAVAALMPVAASHGYNFVSLTDDLTRMLDPHDDRVRGWVDRGLAMQPAFEGRPHAIVAYARFVSDQGDDLETSIYAGFASYMLALMGRHEASSKQIDELRRLVRRYRITFSVDSVGNAYAAAIVNDISRGELSQASSRASSQVPHGSAFSMTAAAALAQTAVLTNDPATMKLAIEWSRLGTIPVLDYMRALVGATAAIMDRDLERAADFAEDVCETARVPVSLVHSWPMLNRALLDAGRIGAATDATESATRFVAQMDNAPLLSAAVHLCNAQMALHTDELGAAVQAAGHLRKVASSAGLALHMVDAMEICGSVAARRGEVETATGILEAARAERNRMGYRHSLIGPNNN